jgi:hypothetical protein
VAEVRIEPTGMIAKAFLELPEFGPFVTWTKCLKSIVGVPVLFLGAGGQEP